ncbi:nucleotide exchange factor GrpE [Thermochromatium tepidum]|uniref:Protein GrpE n=1 Tax=Thermochromatium tepidum ATCC 43061 TaxID=316276 RepID=A0A6I6E4W4_THETI|nr:nucleotide exchange factor GrpE [Thermochromatium tepidum]QGU32862.1 nucleotide exchange factor GrpE [Thermochromatium tepidum ATCC 43061]
MSTEPQSPEVAPQEARQHDEAAVRAAVEAYREADSTLDEISMPTDGLNAEPAATPESEAAQPEEPSVEELSAALDAARAEIEESRDQVLRARAELENLKRRHAQELEKVHKFALDGFVRELLQVRDSLELGCNAARDANTDVGKLREGTELTLKLLGDVMEKFGVGVVDPTGQPFDPEFHQAMSMQPRDDVPPNTVVLVIQKGYTLNGRLVRPALVMVSQAPEQ